MIRIVFAVSLAVSLVALAWVDVVSFGRTCPLRRGERAPPVPTRRADRSSPTTHLAWVAGVLLAGLGLAWARDGPGGRPTTVTSVFVGAGVLVAVTGWWARVIGMSADGSGFTIRYRRSPDFSVTWDRCLELRPPRTPFAGWRVVGSNGMRTLMPSDLLGNEGFLVVLIERAGLRFDGRGWRDPR
jgi:hypothetical protein